jgi:hypothetical protein
MVPRVPGNGMPPISPAAPNAQLQISDPRIMALLQQKQMMIDGLTIQCDSLKQRLSHNTGLIIGILRTFHDGKPVRIPMQVLEEITGDIGINDDVDEVGKQVLIEIITQQQFMLRHAGLVETEADITVPKRSPFTVALELPEGATFMGLMAAAYKGGRSDGTPLEIIVKAKPKKPREVAVEKDGLLRFTADSQGMQVHVKFAVKLKAEEKAAEPDTSEITCEDEFHKSKDAPGVRCMVCGDSRKLPNVQ